VGPSFPVDKFLTIRIPLNQEVDAKKLPRYTNWRNGEPTNGSRDGKAPDPKNAPIPNPLTPISAIGEKPKPGGRDGTVRFMLDPERAENEKAIVSEYFKTEMEEYEVEE
jgi:CTD kinase subunit beta